tara:strand:- start:348 stop:560 length:213 start_codon:yes stop_codon:yes gene_type:complete
MREKNPCFKQGKDRARVQVVVVAARGQLLTRVSPSKVVFIPIVIALLNFLSAEALLEIKSKNYLGSILHH